MLHWTFPKNRYRIHYIMRLKRQKRGAHMKKPEFEIQNGELIEYHGAGGDVVIPDGVTRIADFVFDLCETLTSLTLPASVTDISFEALTSCSKLTEFRVAPEYPVYSTADGVLYSRDGTRLVLYPRGRAGAFVIPDGVTVLCDGAFRTCHGLTGVVIPEHVTVSMRQTIDALQ